MSDPSRVNEVAVSATVPSGESPFGSSNPRSGPAAPSRTYTTDWFWSPELRE